MRETLLNAGMGSLAGMWNYFHDHVEPLEPWIKCDCQTRRARLARRIVRRMPPVPASARRPARWIKLHTLVPVSRQYEYYCLGRQLVADNTRALSHEDQIVIELRPAFDEAVAVLEEAGGLVHPDADPETVMAGGASVAAAYQNLHKALDTLNQIRTKRIAATEWSGEHEAHVSWWLADIADLDELAHAIQLYEAPGHAFHGLIAAGFKLRLNTRVEAELLVMRAQDATATAGPGAG
jgi:hypothetical protein